MKEMAAKGEALAGNKIYQDFQKNVSRGKAQGRQCYQLLDCSLRSYRILLIHSIPGAIVGSGICP